MEKNFCNFKQIIAELREQNSMTDQIRYTILGRIEYAMERKDISITQANELIKMLGGANFLQETRGISDMAIYGEPVANFL